MEKRYQIFVSSTYVDLSEERLEVMRALLELDCIPSGMEYFPANNDEQWTFIKDLIDQCDYYIVVIGARYGSLAADGLSYTEKEYRYALERGIPIAAFLHASPENISLKNGELDSEKREKLSNFRHLAQQKLCKTWSSQAELGAVVSRSLTQLIKRNPRPGWVRSDQLASSEASQEILRLRQIIDKKDAEIIHLNSQRVASTSELAQGNDEVELAFTVSLTDRAQDYHSPNRRFRVTGSRTATWDDIFKSIAPELLTTSKDSVIKSAISRYLKDLEADSYYENYPDLDITSFSITNNSLQLVVLQFSALGLVELSNTEDEKGKLIRLANLTKQGRDYLVTSSAAKRGQKIFTTSGTDISTKAPHLAPSEISESE